MSDYPERLEEPEETASAPEAEEAAPPTGGADVGPDLEFLAAEGYRPEVDEDGDVRFRHEGRTLYLFRQERDPAYFRLALPGAWECESAEEEARALEVVNAVNHDLKVVKAVLHDAVVWIGVEQLYDPPAAYRPHFSRFLDLLGAAAWQVRERMRASG